MVKIPAGEYNGRVMFVDGYEVCKPCKQREDIQKLFDFSQIGQDFLDKTFSGFDLNVPEQVRKMHEAAFEFAKTFRSRSVKEHRGFMALGIPGTGKTHLVSAICGHLMRHGIRVLYFPWVDGSRALRDFDTPEAKRDGRNRIELMKTVDVLFIDDLFKGRDKPTNGQIEWLFEVVNHRYLNLMPILISSERLIDDMMAIDSAIASRLYQMAKRFTVEILGDVMEYNYRLR